MELLCCPVCKEKLRQEERCYCCENGHSFDIAKQNYVNLLRSQKSVHGDDREMVVARRDFLEKGYYAPLRKVLCEEVSNRTPKNGVLVDAGCGEGWYTEGVADARSDLFVVGLDISKDALKWAAKREGISRLAVASCFDMPLEEESADAVLNIFSPLAAKEYARILKKSGYLFRVVPDLYHLWELKKAVYDTPLPNRPETEELAGLSLIERKPIHYNMTLRSSEDIQTLFQMTPYYYRTSFRDRAKLEKLNSLAVKAEFILLVYQK